jgi:uncharacterized protein DUF3313
MITRSRISGLLAIFVLLGLFGCAAQQKSEVADREQYSGFLSNYDDLTEVTGKNGNEYLRWTSPDLKSGKYTKIYPKPVVFFPKIDPQKLASRDVLVQVRDYFSDELKKDLEAQGILATGPGQGVAEVQLAITGVYIGDEGVTAWELLPIGAVVGLGEAAVGARDQIVQLVVEGKATDSTTGKLLASAVYKGVGKDLDNDKTQLTLDDVKPVLDGWAKNMAAQSKHMILMDK